jgi:hypothetical protein
MSQDELEALCVVSSSSCLYLCTSSQDRHPRNLDSEAQGSDPQNPQDIVWHLLAGTFRALNKH